MNKRFGYYMPEMEGLSLPEIERMLAPALREQIAYCHANSELYRQKFQEAGARPEDIQTFDDLRRLPVFMTKDDERASQLESRQRLGHTFGMHVCAPVEDIYLTGTTSGTTGVPTFTYVSCQAKWDKLPNEMGRLSQNHLGPKKDILW